MKEEEKEPRIEGALIEEPEEAPKSSWVLVAQFFIVPIVIVALCVGVFVLFGLITGESRTARDYLEEIKAGKGNRRWQAAFELTKYLSRKNIKVEDPRLAQDLAVAFRRAKDGDPRIRQYLALTLGAIQDAVAVQPLVEALEDGSLETRLYSVWALGQIRDAQAVPALLRVAESQEHDLRISAIYSLGLMQDRRALPVLQAALNDRSPDTRWNAALSLARMHDSAGLNVLHQMLDRNELVRISNVSESQRSEAMINAARAIALLKDASARALLEKIRKEDPDLKVRAAAIDSLKSLP